ncbi:TetR/AcrR family transcriptional regulator [Mycolicibacterium diernhoferi]|uniref:TetR/AcrR family transcriptional regulator n=3 Tax=Mycolicibacterium diernhoferi TaxID=1801 RepID=A0A1Q4H659_9MYCO|nr:TetR/AcrR family transcriptional regulator [Mycolicibacterium diernhoferi]OJZ63040.1 TetR family transcriptional regulator [Mycolicibacterium diernhoferi]PEG53116.1 TetR/AcrR family transcriptional regulator [Mycolicibacterium diernhoferi]QYL22088.1 TetR/AcrR family transcriptional regulator [Mycolicibacterium diernhoferi]
MSGNPSKAEVDPPERILRAAAEILAADGREAVSTRAVSARANVQSPTIYRHFGDMRQLLDAAASRSLADYLATKRSRPHTDDPVEDLRTGWNTHVEFGLRNPHVYTVLYGDPRPGATPQGVAEGEAILLGLVRRIAEAGRLRVGVERAAAMMHSACRGVTITLLSTPAPERDPDLSAATREAILTSITTGAETADTTGVGPRAVALKALLDPPPAALTAAEVTLLAEWLDRLTARA